MLREEARAGGYHGLMTATSPDPRDPFGHPALGESVRALARRGVIHEYRRGRILIGEGETGDTVYVILRGRLRVFGTDARTGREMTYGLYGPGEYVGEMGLDGGPRSASVEVHEPATCSMITRATLLAHIAEHPGFAFELLAKVIARARAATTTAKQLAHSDAYTRMKSLLMRLAVAQPDGSFRLEEALTQQEIADWIGCARELVGRMLKDLEKGGFLEVEGTGKNRRLRWRRLP